MKTLANATDLQALPLLRVKEGPIPPRLSALPPPHGSQVRSYLLGLEMQCLVLTLLSAFYFFGGRV